MRRVTVRQLNTGFVTPRILLNRCLNTPDSRERLGPRVLSF